MIDKVFKGCVLFLLWLAKKLGGMTYNEVNVWIFCVIWPVITVASFALNIYLWMMRK